MIPGGQTERLILRGLELSDADQIQQLFPHWEIVQFLSSAVPWPYPADGALHYCQNVSLPLIERGEGWEWTIRLRTEPTRVIGAISVLKGENNRAFWLGVPWHGRGYMSEASRWATDFWFDTLGNTVLRIPKATSNLASRRISENQGMRVVATMEKDYVSGRLPSEIWEITAKEWRAWKRRLPRGQ
jgi:ribosomal-protein-alanine N-acetyltransferase